MFDIIMAKGGAMEGWTGDMRGLKVRGEVAISEELEPDDRSGS
jgi:hypothetical protein